MISTILERRRAAGGMKHDKHDTLKWAGQGKAGEMAGGLNLSRIYPQEARGGRGLVQAGGMVGMRFERGAEQSGQRAALEKYDILRGEGLVHARHYN